MSMNTVPERLAALRTPSGDPIDIAMTTNGSILAKKSRALSEAGLKRVTVSLDAIDEDIFQGFNDVGFPAAKVLAGIDTALAEGFQVKVNTVENRGQNEADLAGKMIRFLFHL